MYGPRVDLALGAYDVGSCLDSGQFVRRNSRVMKHSTSAGPVGIMDAKDGPISLASRLGLSRRGPRNLRADAILQVRESTYRRKAASSLSKELSARASSDDPFHADSAASRISSRSSLEGAPGDK